MPLDAFVDLCEKTIGVTGEGEFRSDECPMSSDLAKQSGTCPLISGEVKAAASVRMLAGGSHLDLVPLFGMSTSALCGIFDVFF